MCNTCKYVILILLCWIPQVHNYYNDKIVKLFGQSVAEGQIIQFFLYSVKYKPTSQYVLFAYMLLGSSTKAELEGREL